MKLISKVAAVVVAAGAALVALPGTGAAQTGLTVEYDATGWSHIASTDSDLWIKPTTLTATVDANTGAITGSLPLLPADTSFYLAGFVKVKAQVNMEPAGPVTGQLSPGRVDTQASYYIRLSDVLVAGLPTPVGPACQTKEPVVITASTPEGGSFDLDEGGKLVGEFSIGEFEHCGLTTPLLNQIIPGDGNTIDIDVTNGRLG